MITKFLIALGLKRKASARTAAEFFMTEHSPERERIYDEALKAAEQDQLRVVEIAKKRHA